MVNKSTKGLVLRNKALRKFHPAFRAHYQIIVSNALQRNIKFSLSAQRVYDLVASNCVYCGTEPERRIFGSQKYVGLFNGIDRIDPKRGYTRANSVAACKYCNRLKYVGSFREYLEHVVKVARHNKLRV